MTATQATVKTAPKIAFPASVRRVVLTGFMGAGKTTVGRLLAESLGWDFLDLDSHLEARANATIPELFARHRRAALPPPGIFRPGQRARPHLDRPRPRRRHARTAHQPVACWNRPPGTPVVFLDAPFPTLFDRCMLQSFASPDHIRPVLASPAEAEARFHQRQPAYIRLARFTVSTADLTPSETAQIILDHFSGNQ